MKGNQVTKRLFHRTTRFFKRSSPTILTCIGTIGVVATAVMAVKATPKALELIEHERWQRYEGGASKHTDPLKPLEIAKLTWQCYIPTAVVGLSTIACIFGANMLNKRNQASLASAYALLTQSFQQYRKTANEVYGENADLNISAQIAKDAYVSADGFALYSMDKDTESEKVLCYDMHSRRYFVATMAAVLNAQYHINRNLMLRGYVSINEFYEFLGIDKISYGDEHGWSMDELLESGFVWLDFDNNLVEMEDGMRCCVISALWEPSNV